MSKIQFTRAVRTATKIKMAILGPSGSGKTYSALKIASGLGQKIALLDTEAGSSSLYSDYFDFDYIVLRPPFEPKRYIEIIQEAVDAKYDVLIIDSLTHAWDGEGGSMDKKSQLDSRGGRQNEFTNWKPVKQDQKKLTEAINQSDIHIISTLRAKQEYQIVSSGGKTRPEKMGLGPIAMPGTEYEYSIVLEMAMNHEASAAKDRTGLFDGKFFVPDNGTGKIIKEWLSTAKPISEKPPEVKSTSVDNSKSREFLQLVELAKLSTAGFTPDQKQIWIRGTFGTERLIDVATRTIDEINDFARKLELNLKDQQEFQEVHNGLDN